jgi:acetyl-CoA carboxylase carboxyl transferase subunit alpha
MDDKITTLQKEIAAQKQKIYSTLSPYQTMQIARHPSRPSFSDYVSYICEDFVELCGDRQFGDDRALIGGVAKLDGRTVVLVGNQKGKNTKENIERNFGMPKPEGFRKALRLFYHAEQFNLPVITLIDTPGAYPGLEAEERGQAEAIARNIREMSSLKVPIIGVVMGEGGSGGALAISVSDKLYMLEHSIYSVISPEGCASILWKDAKLAPQAAQALKITAKDLLELGIIDGIIPEPLGGAHVDYFQTAQNIKAQVIKALDELTKLDINTRLEQRYNKFKNIGSY